MTRTDSEKLRTQVHASLRRSLLGVLGALCAASGYAGDVTETPFSVSRGDWFVETDAIRWSRDQAFAEDTTMVVYGETLIGYGLTQSIELQTTFIPYAKEEVVNEDGVTHSDGGGDIGFRTNIELIRSDNDRFGLSLLPFVRLPTGYGELQVDRIESGLAIPVAWTITDGWDLSATGVIERIDGSDGNGGVWAISTSFSLDFTVTASIGAYIEVSNIAEDSDLNRWGTTAHLGTVVTLNDHVDLTLGFNLGLTDPAIDQEAFFRFSTLW